MKAKNKTKVKSKFNGYNGFPEPKEVICSDCEKTFLVKFVISRLAYSQKNNWGYWTKQEKDQENYKCNQCLRQIYSDKFAYWQAVQSSKKRNLFRVYLAHNDI